MCATKFLLLKISYLKFSVKNGALKATHFGAHNETEITFSCTSFSIFVL